MRMLYLAWRYGGADPYCLYHGLDASYRPIGRPNATQRLPQHAARLRQVIYGFGLVAHDEAIKLAGGKVERDRRKRMEAVAAARAARA